MPTLRDLLLGDLTVPAPVPLITPFGVVRLGPLTEGDGNPANPAEGLDTSIGGRSDLAAAFDAPAGGIPGIALGLMSAISGIPGLAGLVEGHNANALNEALTEAGLDPTTQGGIEGTLPTPGLLGHLAAAFGLTGPSAPTAPTAPAAAAGLAAALDAMGFSDPAVSDAPPGPGDNPDAFARGGVVPDRQPGLRETITAEPDEFVVRPGPSRRYRALLWAINADDRPRIRALAAR